MAFVGGVEGVGGEEVGSREQLAHGEEAVGVVAREDLLDEVGAPVEPGGLVAEEEDLDAVIARETRDPAEAARGDERGAFAAEAGGVLLAVRPVAVSRAFGLVVGGLGVALNQMRARRCRRSSGSQRRHAPSGRRSGSTSARFQTSLTPVMTTRTRGAPREVALQDLRGLIRVDRRPAAIHDLGAGRARELGGEARRSAVAEGGRVAVDGDVGAGEQRRVRAVALDLLAHDQRGDAQGDLGRKQRERDREADQRSAASPGRPAARSPVLGIVRRTIRR